MEIKKALVEVIATFRKCLRQILLVYSQIVCFNNFGGHRAVARSILEGQNLAKPFLGFARGVCG